MENIDANNKNAITAFTFQGHSEALLQCQSLEQQDQCQQKELSCNADKGTRYLSICFAYLRQHLRPRWLRSILFFRTSDTCLEKTFVAPSVDKSSN